MNAVRHADIVVVGHSLECALSAALLSRREMKVLWLSQVPPAFESSKVGKLATSPGLLPPPEQLPVLRQVLKELALDLDFFRRMESCTLGLLAPRVRLSFPEDRTQLPEAAETFSNWADFAENSRERSSRPLNFSVSGLRALSQDEAELAAQEPKVASEELSSLFNGLRLAAGNGIYSNAATAAIASAPHLLKGGRPWLVEMLQRRFQDRGGRVLPDALNAPARELRREFRGLRLTLSNGDVVTAPAMILGLPPEQVSRLFPVVSGWFSRKLEAALANFPKEKPMLQGRWVVASAGLPHALGQVSVISNNRPISNNGPISNNDPTSNNGQASNMDQASNRGPRSNTGQILVERRDLSAEHSELRAYRQLDQAADNAEVLSTLSQELKKDVESVLPFFDRHLAEEDFRTLPFYGKSELRPSRIGRVHLALPGVAGLDGWEGAAQIALATAARLTVKKKGQ